jgi:hypothetical protein
MAIAKFGAIITDSRGSVGGTTVKWSRYGHVLLAKPIPTFHRSETQAVQRSLFTNFSKQWWSVLTSSQRDDWRALAAANPRPNRWGTDFPLTGLALFIAINSALVKAGNSSTLDAPADQTVTTLSTLSFSLSSPSTASVSFTPSPAPTDHQLVIEASTKTSPGLENYSKTFRFIFATAAAATSPVNVATPLLALLHSISTDRQYAVQAHFLNNSNGALSPPLVATAIAT